MIDLNRGLKQAYPRLKIGQAEQVNVPELAEALAKLVPIGLKVSASETRRKIGMEEPDDDSDLLGALPAPASPEGQTGDPTVTPPDGGAVAPPGEDPQPRQKREDDDAAPTGQAASSERCPGCGATSTAIARAGGAVTDDALDDLVGEVLEEEGWEPLLEPVVGPIRALLAEAASFEAFRERLAEVLGEAGTEHLTEALAKPLFAARLAGETAAPITDDDSISS